MIEAGEWPHRVKASRHGTDIVYRYRVNTGLTHVPPVGPMYRRTFAPPVPWECHFSRINEMRRWCREFIGRDVVEFNCRAMRLSSVSAAPKMTCFLFIRENDAVAFMVRWVGARDDREG